MTREMGFQWSFLNPSEDELTRFSRELLKRNGATPSLWMKLSVRWNSRLRSTAGMAYAREGRVALNPGLKELPDELDRTLRHELAHLLARDRVGMRKRIEPHGKEWQQACIDLGIPGESRCHSIPWERKRMARRHIYQCRKCGVRLERVRPLKRESACRKCCKILNGGKYSPEFRFVPVLVSS